MVVIICFKCEEQYAGEQLNCPRCDVSNELILKHKKVYVINPRLKRWKVIIGTILLILTLILIFINYPAAAAICFVSGITLTLYDKFQNFCV